MKHSVMRTRKIENSNDKTEKYITKFLKQKSRLMEKAARMAEELDEITEHEIERAISKLNPHRSPGTNGLT